MKTIWLTEEQETAFRKVCKWMKYYFPDTDPIRLAIQEVIKAMNAAPRANDPHYIEEQARLLRAGSQIAGISTSESWDEIAEYRKIRWRQLALGITETGHVVVSIDLLTKLREGIICEENDYDGLDYAGIEEATDVLDKILGTAAGGDDAES